MDEKTLSDTARLGYPNNSLTATQ